ncbi:restriction endonuclease subunit S [Enterococcus faecium]|uniref:restriction endonuclease subunit S n=1 Tax=Enterococcus faecium TaxID=1352 RepID=UPI003CE4942B
MSKDKQPEIRFPGFTEDWEERKLDEIFGKIRNAFVGTATPYYVDEGHFYLESNNVKDGRINRNTEVFINDEFYEKQKDKWLHTNDIVMVQSGHVGHTAVIPEDLDKTAAHALIMFSNYKTKTSPFFLNYQFQTLTAKRKLENITTGNTIKHILASEMKKFEVTIPEHVEQQKIGSFFKTFDDTIALHQRKLDLLKETKKGFLQKMFPKNGAKVPEIRFPGFTKDWEERKLGDVFSERSERSSEGELISVTINSGVIKASELDRKDNSSDNKSNYKKVEVGDIAYNSMRMWQGASGYSSYEGILSPAYTVIIPKEGTDSKFFAYDFKRYDMIQTFKRNSQGLTSDTWNLKFPTLKLVKIMVPSIEEQKQIAAFFERLDNTIALHERELDVLKETKKGFLQKMFV